jgi:hypothetical protein
VAPVGERAEFGRLLPQGGNIMSDHRIRPALALIARAAVCPILLCGVIAINFPAMAQESTTPALSSKAYPANNQGKSTAQQLKEDNARNTARLLELKARIKSENAKRGIVPLAERMKPAGSNPAPSPGNPNPVRKK